MRTLSKQGNHLKRVFNSTLHACYAESRRLFLIFLLTYIHFDGAHDSHGFPRTYIESRNGGGARWCFFYIFPFPPLLKEKYGFNLLTEIYGTAPGSVSRFFFQSGPTYHFCCMINTTILRRTSKCNIRNGPPSVVLK